MHHCANTCIVFRWPVELFRFQRNHRPWGIQSGVIRVAGIEHKHRRFVLSYLVSTFAQHVAATTCAVGDGTAECSLSRRMLFYRPFADVSFRRGLRARRRRRRPPSRCWICRTGIVRVLTHPFFIGAQRRGLFAPLLAMRTGKKYGHWWRSTPGMIHTVRRRHF